MATRDESALAHAAARRSRRHKTRASRHHKNVCYADSRRLARHSRRRSAGHAVRGDRLGARRAKDRLEAAPALCRESSAKVVRTWALRTLRFGDISALIFNAEATRGALRAAAEEGPRVRAVAPDDGPVLRVARDLNLRA